MSADKTVTSAYNADWKKKAEDPGRVGFQSRVVDAFVNLFENVLGVPFRGRLLDLGCGDGTVTAGLNASGLVQAEGIDIGHGIDFETDKLPFGDGIFDHVLMYSVIEHLHNPGNILAEIRRVLKPGGRVIVITPNFDMSNLLVCERQFYDDPTHVHPYSPVSLEWVMKLYGLRKAFLGLWTVTKSAAFWRLPAGLQFIVGALLPFPGSSRWAPGFLKGRSKTILAVFENGG